MIVTAENYFLPLWKHFTWVLPNSSVFFPVNLLRLLISAAKS